MIIFEVYFYSTERSEGEGDQKLTNQFSYVERATQTMNNTLKVIAILWVAIRAHNLSNFGSRVITINGIW